MAKKLAFDKVLFTVVVLLVGLGLVMVYSASAAISRGRGFTVNPFLIKQAAAATIGLFLMAVVMHVDYRHLRRPAVIYTLLGIVLVALVAVLFAPPLNNTRRWLFIGGLSVQASELAKLALVPFLAYQIERKRERANQPELLVPAAGLTALMAALVLLEPDLGTAVLLTATTTSMLFLAGLPWKWLAVAAGAVLPALWFAVVLVPYRRQRLFAFLDPDKDPLGSGFQAMQSLIAVGSGGVFGLGPGNSLQKLYYLPHPHSDFIFAILAEELGMIGGIAVLLLFGVLLWRGLRAGSRAPDALGRYLGWGFTVMLVLQAFINVSVAVALLPTKGIPLPFLSYGGSSLVTSMVACGVLLNVSQHG